MAPCGVNETIVPWKALLRTEGEYEVSGGKVDLTSVFFEVRRIRLRARSTFNTCGLENAMSGFLPGL
jgi:hypothetical protein